MVVISGAVFMLFSAALPAFAQDINPCAKDLKQYCYDVKPGGGRLLRCYEDNKDKMSPACKAWAERVKSNAAALKEACSKEIDAGCNFEKGDPLEVINCLQGNYTSLSPECTSTLNQFKWLHPVPAR
jgi:hypothetical protein